MDAVQQDAGRVTPVARLRYLDLLRVVAISAVVVGHWLLIAVTYEDGRFSGVDALQHVRWARWATLVFQVMPVFFLVGGYANSNSWSARSARGETWTRWVRVRVMQLLWPTTVYIAFAVVVVVPAIVGGFDVTELSRAAWLAALQLWFLPVYLLLLALTPALHAAYERWGLGLPLVMAAGAVLADIGVVGLHLHFVGYSTYLLVWGSMYVWGMAWRSGALTRDRRVPVLMFGGGAVALAALVGWGPFPVNMIGAGDKVGNTTPPSVALLAFAVAQTGVVLMLQPAATRALEGPRLWGAVRQLNPMVMTFYLWHMVPVLVVSAVVFPTGLMPQPDLGTTGWWLLRIVWVLLLAATMVPLTLLVMRAQRPMLRLPEAVGRAGPWSPVMVGLGTLAAMVGLANLAIRGFAPGGVLPALTLAVYAAGVVLTFCSGSVDRAARDRTTVLPSGGRSAP